MGTEAPVGSQLGPGKDNRMRDGAPAPGGLAAAMRVVDDRGQATWRRGAGCERLQKARRRLGGGGGRWQELKRSPGLGREPQGEADV